MQSLVLQGMQPSLDFSDFCEGVYLLRIENNEGHWQQIRLMIIK
jgi:hypothetical protein